MKKKNEVMSPKGKKGKRRKKSECLSIKNSINIQNKKIKSKRVTTVVNKMTEIENFMKSMSPSKSNEIQIDIPNDYNELPFTQALRIDKRNIFIVFKSIIFDKLELVSLIINENRIRIICICEYIISLIFDFFFNAFLYSDEVVSHKYHNNGELDSIVSISLSIMSNIITSIVCYYVQYSKGIELRIEEIMEIKNEYRYIYAFQKFLKYIKCKLFFFIIEEIVLIGVCFYYILIFCIIYNKSQVSLFVNYIYSLIEGFLTSLSITLVIVITRQLGIHFSNCYLYNASKFINEKF